MSLDLLALWTITAINTLGLLLVVRQLAALPQFSRRLGPRKGESLGDWEMKTPDGDIVRGRDVSGAYTLLFVSATCGPCHELFAELRDTGRHAGTLYVVAHGDPAVVSAEAVSPQGLVYDRLLVGNREDPLFVRLSIPGTPYAVAVRDGKVVRAGIAAKAEQLARVSSAAIDRLRSSPP